MLRGHRSSMEESTNRELDRLRAELVAFRRRWQALRVYWAREDGITTRTELAKRMTQPKQAEQLTKARTKAMQALAREAANLFMEGFVPLAARIVEALGEEKFVDAPEAPPTQWRSGRPRTVADLFDTEDTNEMGRRALIWAARANDTHRWRRADDYPGRVWQWAARMICDPEEEAEPKWRTLGQPIRNALWFLEQQVKKRQSVNDGSDHRELCVADKDAPSEPRSFSGGRMVFFQDRVELCGVDICSGARSDRKRKVLDLLRNRRKDGTFAEYSGSDLAEKTGLAGGQNSAAGLIRDLRTQISQALRREANIECGKEDVILSGGPGYRLSNSLSVQDGGKTNIEDITDIEGGTDVPDVRNDDVRNVRDPAVPNDVRNVEAWERRKWILQQLAENRQLKAPDVADQFKCSIKTAQRDLKALKGEIEFVGQPRTGYYRLREPD